MRNLEGKLDRLTAAATSWFGSSWAILAAFLTVLLWVLGGLLFFGFGEIYQLVINTGTTIVTFLMVFLIQRTQNREALASQVKLNELLAALDRASPLLINVEDLSETELRKLRARFAALRELDSGPHSVHETRGDK